MGRIVVLISSKGGSGKSTIAVGLATAFSNAGKKVLLIDADEGARCLDTMLFVDDNTVFDIGDVLSEKISVNDAMLKVATLPGVWVVPSPATAELIDLSRLAELAESLREQFDYIIIDTKGQMPAERVVKLTDKAEYISVVTTDPIAVRNTGVLNAGLMKYGIKTRLIINRFKEKGNDRKPINIDNLIDTCGARLLGIVPEDKTINLAGNRPMLLGTASSAVFRIASRLDGNNVPLPTVKDII